MSARGEPGRTAEALRERITRLTEASLRINASLDLDTVLHEVVESACALTGAQFGLIITLDDTARPQEFVTFGRSPEEHRRLEEWPDGPRLFDHLRDLPAPLRVPDIHAYVRALGFSPHLLPGGAMQATPLRYLGEHVGNFYLAGKQGARAFTDEDEEMLLLFAAQAANAIANAHAYRKEKRARADLEALVDTSPVGVAVFDGKSGQAVSINRETRRILSALQKPGQTPEALLDILICRRGDGREISLRDYPLARQMDNELPEVRAEEMVLSVPDGRSVATLINATPIIADGARVESMVVTMQDLEPLQAIERMRTEFISLVSHELRAPLAAIRGSLTELLDAHAALDPAEVREYHRIIDEQARQMRSLIGDLLDTGRIESGTLSVRPRPSDLADLVDRARNTFRIGRSPHDVLIDLERDLPPVMAEPRRIVQVLNNLLANAARHSPASSPIRITAAREGVHVAVSVADEGKGVAPERLALLFQKHPSAGDARRRLGGGLGLAICKGLVEAHGGRIRAESAGPGQGTRFTFTLPAVEAAPDLAQTGQAGPDSLRHGRERPLVLVVDDDPQTLRNVRNALRPSGYDISVTGEHHELSRILRAQQPDLVLLDLVLPDADGIELMGRVPELADQPVIFLSAYGRDETVARALQSGAADYIVKPFSPTELTARIAAELRRRDRSGAIELGDLRIDYGRRRVSVAGRAVTLTPTEYDLLRALALNAGRVLTYKSLLRRVWRGRGHATPKLVQAFVKRLRQKLGDDAQRPAYILNERGVGYRMDWPGSA